jgi:hypothetical protein
MQTNNIPSESNQVRKTAVDENEHKAGIPVEHNEDVEKPTPMHERLRELAWRYIEMTEHVAIRFVLLILLLLALFKVLSAEVNGIEEQRLHRKATNSVGP